MKRALLYLISVACVIAGLWGFAYEFAYFRFLDFDVSQKLGLEHYIFSGLSNIIPMLVIAILLSLLVKFFSKDVLRDDMKHFKDEMVKSNPMLQVTGARIAFVLSLAFLLFVLIDTKLGLFEGIGYRNFWLITFLNMQVFVGAIYLSPTHSKAAILVAFVVAVSFCFIAGGVDHARQSMKEGIVLRDDAVVHVERKGATLVITPKSIDLPFPPLQRAVNWLRSKKV